MFVFAIGYGVATGMVLAAQLGGAYSALLDALPVTALTTLIALVFVRCVPLPLWTCKR